MIEDAYSVITSELEKVQGPRKHTATNLFICCPFHDERTPSLSINLSDNAKVNIGTFMCFGCQAKGHWNVLAEKLGLRQVKEWQHFKGTTDGVQERHMNRRKDLRGITNDSIQRLFDEIGNAVLPWPENQKWRNYGGKLLKRIGAYMYNDKRFDEIMLVLPIYINGRYKGGVKALYEKPKKGPSYINTNGDWVQDFGLLGYDYVRKRKLWGCKAIVVVEGPRDWLRLVKNKIPACGILGSKMFNQKKMMLLMALGVEKIYILPDNDRAGASMAQLVEDVCRNFIETEHLVLPRKKDEKGNVIALDPDNAPQKIIDKVKRIVYEHR